MELFDFYYISGYYIEPFLGVDSSIYFNPIHLRKENGFSPRTFLKLIIPIFNKFFRNNDKIIEILSKNCFDGEKKEQYDFTK